MRGCRSLRCRCAGQRPARRDLAGIALSLLVLASCATPSPEPQPAAPPLPIVVLPAPAPACPTCDDQTREVARLKQDLAAREAELRELRATQREQTKSAQETTREATRAKAKARRLATQADAASYLAEVEVALNALRASQPNSVVPVSLAAGFLESAAQPFARGDYANAMERAAQAEAVIALAAEVKAAAEKRARAPREWPLQAALPLRVTADSHLRRQPRGSAAAVGIVRKDSALAGHAYTNGWLRVETEDGRSGWVAQAQLAAR